METASAEEFGAVIGRIGFEDAVNGMQHFAGHGGDCWTDLPPAVCSCS